MKDLLMHGSRAGADPLIQHRTAFQPIRSLPWRDLIMPQFSETLLALMGISAGTYIGFKIPERQTEPEPQPTAEAEPSDEASKSLAAGAGGS
jgi:hypothetical protein